MKPRVILIVLVFVVLLGCSDGNENKIETQPNIVMFVADDLGWNDVGFHGSNQIPTPNIDALAYNGVVLNRHYTMPTCTPSRTALLTGKYPIRTGMQGYPLRAGEPRGLPLNEVTLPARLKQLGYVTRLLGKWHQGNFRTEYTPTCRGFDSFLGYWNAHNAYFSDRLEEEGREGFNFRRDNCTTRDYVGQYATEVFTQEAESIIRAHRTAQPLYLQIAHLAPHAGNDDNPLEVPDVEEANRKFSYISKPERRLFAEMVSELDKSVGLVVKALADRGMLNDTILVFISDNGAKTYGSNWPLRGLKFTLHEGGVRNTGAIWSSRFQEPGRVSSQLFHLSDWLPTLYSAAGGDPSTLGQIDGINQWASLVQPTAVDPRTQVLLNIDDAQPMEALISNQWKIRRGDYKNGTFDGYYGDNGRGPENPEYDVTAILGSHVNQALKTLRISPLELDKNMIQSLRLESEVICPNIETKTEGNARDNSTGCYDDYCLFDIHKDPCEVNNMASANVETVRELAAILDRLRTLAIPQNNKPLDPAGDPHLHNDTWVSWLDDAGSITEQCNSPAVSMVQTASDGTAVTVGWCLIFSVVINALRFI